MHLLNLVVLEVHRGSHLERDQTEKDTLCVESKVDDRVQTIVDQELFTLVPAGLPLCGSLATANGLSVVSIVQDDTPCVLASILQPEFPRMFLTANDFTWYSM